jgi:hypothetical protein
MHLQTCAVVAIGVFGATLGAAYQCILLSAAFGISLLLLAVLKPYNHAAVNALGAKSFACLTLTAQGALVLSMLAVTESEGTANQQAAATTAVAAAVLAVNVAFVVSVIWRVLRVVEWGVLKRAASNAVEFVRRKSQRRGRGRRGWPGCVC